MITILEGEVSKNELRRSRLNRLLNRTVRCLCCLKTFSVTSLDDIVEEEEDYRRFNLKCPHCGRLVDYDMADQPTDEEAIASYLEQLTKTDPVRSHHAGFKRILLAVYKAGYEAFEEEALVKEYRRGMGDGLNIAKVQISQAAADKFLRGQDSEAQRLRDLANSLHLPK